MTAGLLLQLNRRSYLNLFLVLGLWVLSARLSPDPKWQANVKYKWLLLGGSIGQDQICREGGLLASFTRDSTRGRLPSAVVESYSAVYEEQVVSIGTQITFLCFLRCGAITAVCYCLWHVPILELVTFRIDIYQKAGAMVWATIITLYSTAGAIFLFLDGAFFFFTSPEWHIYAAISLVVGITAFLTLCAFSNKSYVWIRATKFLWSIIIVISAIRAIVIILELQRGKDKIIWECNNGGQLYSASVAAGYHTSTALPSQFCADGFSSFYTAWIIALLVDLAFQFYMAFLTWRYSKRLEHYSDLKSTSDELTYG